MPNKDITLVEVRKAYRLLYSYQKGILNLMNYIGKRLGFTFENIEPRFSNESNYKKLEKNAWDWLNLYCCAFHFTNEREEGKTVIYFSIFLITDTGFFEKGLHNNSNNKSTLIYKLEEYEEEKDSNSKLIFVVGESQVDKVNRNDIKNYFKEYRDLLKEEEGKYDKEGKKIFYKYYNLEEFLDEDGAREKLEDFVRSCKEEGISLELKDKIGD